MITEQPLLLLKPQRKPFCIIIFQSETCCKATLVRRYFSGKVSCHAIELIFIDYEHGCLASCKLHNNFLQISCCEFEYFSMNKPYTSRRRQRNERTKSQNELAWTYGAFIHENIDIHNRVRTPEKCSPRIYLPFSKQSIEAIARGSTSLVWQLLSYEELYLLPWIWIRLWLSY